MLLTKKALEEKQSELLGLQQRLAEVRKEKKAILEQADGDGWHDNFAYELACRDEKVCYEQIAQLKDMINNATIIEVDENSKDKVLVGSIVELEIDYGAGDVERLTGELVSLSNNLFDGSEITLNSPIGKAILERSKGDIIKCKLHDSQIQITIIDFH